MRSTKNYMRSLAISYHRPGQIRLFRNARTNYPNFALFRCDDKTYRIGSECRFSNDDMESDPRKDGTQENGFHFVVKGVYSYGKNKSQQEKARRFLDKIGGF